MKQVFNFQKEAMSVGPWQVYRGMLQWWPLEDLETGADPSWNRWVEGDPEKFLPPNPSMNGALQRIRDWYYNKKLLFRARYGCSDEEVDRMFQVNVGYDPKYGVYMVSSGPYMAEAPAWHSTNIFRSLKKVPLEPEALLQLSNSMPSDEKTLAIMKSKNDPMYQDIHSSLVQIAKGQKGGLTSIKNPKTELQNILKLKQSILEVRSDLRNKFSFFTWRFGRAEKEEILANVRKIVDHVFKYFGNLEISPEDVKFVLSEMPSGEVGKEGNASQIQHVYKNITENSPEGQALFVERPIVGVGSYFALSASGIKKVLEKASKDGKWADAYDEGLKMLAKQNKMTLDQTRELLATDEDMMEGFLKVLRTMRDNFKKNKDPKAEMMNIPKQGPKPEDMGYQRVGQLRPSSLRISSTQRSIQQIRLDILRAIVELKGADPVKLSDYLNESRKKHKGTKAKGVFTPEILSGWLAKLESEGRIIDKKGKVKGHKSYKTLLKENENLQKEMEDNESLRDCGFETLTDVYRISSASFMETPEEFVDKKTRAKMNVIDNPNIFAKGDEGYGPYEAITAEALTSMRMNARKKGTEKDMEKQIRADISKEIGDKNKQKEQAPKVLYQPANIEDAQEEIMSESEPEKPVILDVDTDVVEGKPVPAQEEISPVQFDVTEMKTPQEKVELPPTAEPKVPEKLKKKKNVKKPDPEIEPVGAPSGLQLPQEFGPEDIIAGTINRLIKIARDLDNRGKEKAAEEIHQIIRKYQSKL